jgi:predicted naringenin-chalcone synthase
VVATEVTSTLVRSELEELDRASTEKNGVKAVMAEMGNVGVCLFSDGASALVVGGGKVKEDGEFRFPRDRED